MKQIDTVFLTYYHVNFFWDENGILQKKGVDIPAESLKYLQGYCDMIKALGNFRYYEIRNYSNEVINA